PVLPGGVYSPVFVIVPELAEPPTTPSTDHVTVPPVVVNCCVRVKVRTVTIGLTDMVGFSDNGRSAATAAPRKKTQLIRLAPTKIRDIVFNLKQNKVGSLYSRIYGSRDAE